MIEIIKYWRQKDIDVTKEWFNHEFAGLVPMAWHLNLDESSRLKYSPSVICGGGSGSNLRRKTYREAPWIGWFTSPEAGCLYEEAWGHSIDRGIKNINDLDEFSEQFYLKTLPWYFLNRLKVIEHVHTNEYYEV